MPEGFFYAHNPSATASYHISSSPFYQVHPGPPYTRNTRLPIYKPFLPAPQIPVLLYPYPSSIPSSRHPCTSSTNPEFPDAPSIQQGSVMYIVSVQVCIAAYKP